MDEFDIAAEKAIKDFGANMGVQMDENRGPEATTLNTQAKSERQEEVAEQPNNLTTSEAQALAELEKIGKFKYQGKEWTLQDLEKAMLRQQDYTKKTQTLSEERKAFEQDRKFYENLHADLAKVRANPKLVSDFVRVYPEKFHQYLNGVAQEEEQADEASTAQEQRPMTQQIPVELYSRINRIEKHFNELEVAKNRQEIDSTVDELSRKYPDANPELALSRAFETYEGGTKLTKEVWEDIFKKCDQDGKHWMKSRYAELVKNKRLQIIKVKTLIAVVEPLTVLLNHLRALTRLQRTQYLKSETSN
jgi:hypothetical protein